LADIRKEVMGQIRALRRRIDPRLLEKVRAAVYASDGAEAFRSEKDNARAAVASFLATRQDNGAFRKALDQELRQHGRRLDQLLPPAAELQAPPAVVKALNTPLKAEVLLSAPLPQDKQGNKQAEKPVAKPKRKFWPFL
jgi:hypothetical protein